MLMSKRFGRRAGEDFEIGHLLIRIRETSVEDCARLALNNIVDLRAFEKAKVDEIRTLVQTATDPKLSLELLSVPKPLEEIFSDIKPVVIMLNEVRVHAHHYSFR